MSKSKTKQEEALQLLDDLDSLNNETSAALPHTKGAAGGGGEAEALAFIDEITQKSAEPTRSIASLDKPSRSATPSLRKSGERVKIGGGSTGSGRNTPVTASAQQIQSPTEGKGKAPEASPAAGTTSNSGWGWGSVWSTASAALQQAREVVDEQVKNLPQNEQAKKWRDQAMEYAKSAQLDKLSQDFRRVGLSTLTDILNVVAPPISQHEIIQVWLSHDLHGYEGVESLVYQALARILQQVEGGDLVVKQSESRPKESEGRNLNAVDGYEAASKLAKANLEELIKIKEESKPQAAAPGSAATYSYVYLRIQPYYAATPTPSGSDDKGKEKAASLRNLQFLLMFTDPGHNLVHSTVSQPVPEIWLGLWDSYDWVEELVAETMRLSVEVIGQEYVVARMGWASKATATQHKEEGGTVSDASDETDDDDDDEEEEDEEENANAKS